MHCASPLVEGPAHLPGGQFDEKLPDFAVIKVTRQIAGSLARENGKARGRLRRLPRNGVILDHFAAVNGC
jgi:hypothetical protein